MLTDDQIESIAEKFRDDLGIADQYSPNMVGVVRRMKELRKLDDIQIFPDGQFGPSEASYSPETRTMYISVSCVSEQQPKHRFTIAHEIGHFLGGHKFSRHRRADHRQQFGAEIRQDETEANRIAAAILVPEQLADVSMATTAEEIAKKFRVSVPMAGYRLSTLQARFRARHGITRKPLPLATLGPDGSIILVRREEFDSGDYDAASREMARNSQRWNSR